MKMWYKLLTILILIFMQSIAYSQALVGEISKADYKTKRPQVIDAISKNPIGNATVMIPSEGKIDYTDSNGHFKIAPSTGKPVILSVQKEGYRPYSLTLQDGKLKTGLLMEMTKESPFEVVISDNLLHLGDNSYSEKSAGACLINAPCIGPTFTKDFFVKKLLPTTKAYVIIGSVIGIDTLQAMKLGQNRLSSATSTPMEIFINKNKIGELKINGDNQKIPIPLKVLHSNAYNNITVKTGVNQNDSEAVDYDDIELMNLVVDIK